MTVRAPLPAPTEEPVSGATDPIEGGVGAPDGDALEDGALGVGVPAVNETGDFAVQPLTNPAAASEIVAIATWIR